MPDFVITVTEGDCAIYDGTKRLGSASTTIEAVDVLCRLTGIEQASLKARLCLEKDSAYIEVFVTPQDLVHPHP